MDKMRTHLHDPHGNMTLSSLIINSAADSLYSTVRVYEVQ